MQGKAFFGRSLPVQITLLIGIWLAGFLLLSVLFWAIGKIVNHRTIREKTIRALDILSTSRPLFKIGMVTATALLALLAILHLRLVFYPYQMEFREGAIVLTTQAFLEGINPWSLENNLTYINVYGIVYNAVVLPFAALFGNTLWIHRLVSFLAVIGQLILIASVMRKKGIRWLYVLFTAVYIWLGQIYYTTPMARPDTLGQLFFLLTILLPVLGNFSRRSLIFSILFGWLGFFTKPYFVLGFPLVAAYLFLFENKRTAILYALAGGVLIGISSLVINHFFEAYFLNVIFSHVADTNSIYEFMLKQSARFVGEYWSILSIALVAVIIAAVGIKLDEFRGHILNFKAKQPFFYFKMDILLFCLLIAAVLIYASLGRHNGTQMAYYYQLISPFLLILVFGYLERHPQLSGLAVICISINLIFHGWGNLKPDLKPWPTENWIRIQHYLEGQTEVIHSPAITYEVMKAGIPVMNSGQTSYFYPYPKSDFFLYPSKDRIAQIGDAFFAELAQRIAAQEYDIILVDAPYPAFAKRKYYETYYQPGEEIVISMPHTEQTWPIQVMTPIQKDATAP